MNTGYLNILLIEDNPGDAALTEVFLTNSSLNIENIYIQPTLSSGLSFLKNNNVDLILLDLDLPDSMREHTLKDFLNPNYNIPIIILTGSTDEKVASKCIDQGVQDYLVKGKFDSYSLYHAVKYSLLRYEHEFKVKEINIFKNKLTRIISHDIKGPLATMTTYTGMILEDLNSMTEDMLREDLTNLDEISKSVYNLVQNLFNWGKMQFEKIEIKPEKISLKQIVSENLTLFKHQAKGKNISVHNAISDDCTVLADSETVKAVIRNLLYNSIKFTNRNGKIQITGQKNNGNVEISVIDNGIGIEQDELEDILNNGVDSLKIGTNNEVGSGFGLSLCKEFVELNGGKIWINSQEDEGTNISFSLPRLN